MADYLKSPDNPTMADVAQLIKGKVAISSIIEILAKRSDFLTDMTLQKANNTDSNTTVIRNSLPDVQTRLYNQGIKSSKSSYGTITDRAAMFTATSKVDTKLAGLGNKAKEIRWAEDKAFMESFRQKITEVSFFGDERINPSEFNGLRTRFNTLNTNAAQVDNIFNATPNGKPSGQEDGNYGSIWLIHWSPMTTYMFYPEGYEDTAAGMRMQDLGIQIGRQDAADGTEGDLPMYMSLFEWDLGLAVSDWRGVARICNIPRNTVVGDTSDADKSPDLNTLLRRATIMMSQLGPGRTAIYMDTIMAAILDEQISRSIDQSTLTYEQVGGMSMPVMQWKKIPVRLVDQLNMGEPRVTA